MEFDALRQLIQYHSGLIKSTVSTKLPLVLPDLPQCPKNPPTITTHLQPVGMTESIPILGVILQVQRGHPA